MPITQGKVNVPVVNVGTEDQLLQPRITLGTLHIVAPTPCGDQVVLVQSVGASTSASVDF